MGFILRAIFYTLLPRDKKARLAVLLVLLAIVGAFTFLVPKSSAYSNGDIPICTQSQIPPKDKADQMLASMNGGGGVDGYVLTREGDGFYNLVVTQSPLDHPIRFGSAYLYTSDSSAYRSIFELPNYTVNTAWQSFNSQTLPLNSPDCVVFKTTNVGIQNDGGANNFDSVPTYSQRYATVTCDQNLQDYNDSTNTCVDRTCANQFDPTYTGTYPDCVPPACDNGGTDYPTCTPPSDPEPSSDYEFYAKTAGISVAGVFGLYIVHLLRYRGTQ